MPIPYYGDEKVSTLYNLLGLRLLAEAVAGQHNWGYHVLLLSGIGAGSFYGFERSRVSDSKHYENNDHLKDGK